MLGKHRGSLQGIHPAVIALEAKIRAEHAAMTPEQHEARYQRAVAMAERRIDDAVNLPDVPAHIPPVPRAAALYARQHLTPNESRFFTESHARWPGVRFRRYAPVSIALVVGERPSVWYAPFLCRPKKLVIVFDHRPECPYRLYGENRALYAQHGYTVLDFSEDLSCPFDQAVWDEAMTMIDAAIAPVVRRAA